MGLETWEAELFSSRDFQRDHVMFKGAILSGRQTYLFLLSVLRCRDVPPRKWWPSDVQYYLDNARVLVETLYPIVIGRGAGRSGPGLGQRSAG